MKPIKLLVLSACLSTVLTGCIFVNGHSDGHHDSSYSHQIRTNNEKIGLLDIGATRQEVIDSLGKPDISEASQKSDSDFYVLYYRTQKKHSDKESVKSVSTPLVFQNDRLIGWGHELVEKIGL